MWKRVTNGLQPASRQSVSSWIIIHLVKKLIFVCVTLRFFPAHAPFFVSMNPTVVIPIIKGTIDQGITA